MVLRMRIEEKILQAAEQSGLLAINHITIPWPNELEKVMVAGVERYPLC